ncbi:histidine kinase dimerization/phospho-acceptor domain-containing protein [Pseudoroseomonas wenyumeiae]
MPVYISLGLLPLEGERPMLCGVLTDLTVQKGHLRELSVANAQLRAESAQREAAEAALRQSQKMEAVGQLTGGIAHDFNNLLTGIMGSLDLVQGLLARGQMAGMERYVAAAMSSASRAAALTHRLLAFSRRQTLDPRRLSPTGWCRGWRSWWPAPWAPTSRWTWRWPPMPAPSSATPASLRTRC